MKISDTQVSGDIFSGLPGDEEVFLEKNPLGSDSVYIRVKPPNAPEAAAKTILLTQTAPDVITRITLGDTRNPVTKKNDGKIDVIYTVKPPTKSLPVWPPLKVFQNHRDIAVRVSSALGITQSELYAAQKSETPDTTRSGNVEWRVSNLEREVRSLDWDQTRLKSDLDQNERADKIRDEKLAALDKRATELALRIEELKKRSTITSEDDLKSLRRDLEELKSDVDDLSSRMDDAENEIDDIKDKIDDLDFEK